MKDTALPGPTGIAQLRYLRRAFREPQPVLDELRNDFGPVCRFGFGPAKMAIVGDPAALKELFATSSGSFRWGHKFNVLGFVVGDTSMIVSDGPDHRRRRSSVQSAFSRRRLNGWIPMILEQTDRTVDALLAGPAAPGGTVDLAPIARSLVLAVTVRAFFGGRFATRADEIGDLFERPQAYLESPALRQLPHPFPFTARSRVRADRRMLDSIIDAEIATLRQSEADDPLDILGTLVGGVTLTDHEIRDQVVTLIGAGYNTTAASLSWMLWRAVLEPGTWKSLRAEADEVLGLPDTDTSAADFATLGRLELAERVMRETLRLHPAGVVAPREAATDVRLGGRVIPKGTLILWSAYLAGRDPQAWPDPLRFDPDRFRDPTPQQAAIIDTAWVPFGHGARNCIGFALAQMELTLMIARLAQRLDVTTTASKPPPPVGMVVNRPAGGTNMNVNQRDSAPTGLGGVR